MALCGIQRYCLPKSLQYFHHWQNLLQAPMRGQFHQVSPALCNPGGTVTVDVSGSKCVTETEVSVYFEGNKIETHVISAADAVWKTSFKDSGKYEFKVKVKVGDEYAHPDDFDHYIAYVQLWNGETFLAQANFEAGTLGSAAGQVEVDFYIVPTKKMKFTAMAYCTKHGLWQSDEVVVEVA